MKETPESAEARNPETSSDRLGQLADLYPELHSLIVTNPSCPPELRRWIIDDYKSKEAAEAWNRHQSRQAPTQTSPVQTQQIPRVYTQSPPARVQTASVPGRPRSGSSCGKSALGCLVIAVAIMVLLYGCFAVIGKFSSSRSQSSATPTPEKASPAPAGAVTSDLFQSPSKNIACEITGGQINCFVNERFYVDGGQQDCDETLFAISVAQGDAGVSCGLEFSGHESETLQTLEYGTTATSSSGDYACSSSEEGMTCWNQWTGKGFTVSRESYSIF